MDQNERPWQTCDRCNYDRHICPGCGDNLRHGEEACTDCVARVRRENFHVVIGSVQ
jgi:hypothetical protein